MGFVPAIGSTRQCGDGAAANVRRLPSAKSLAPGMRMHPNTPNVRMVDNFGGYTAAAGHAFMVSDALPPRLQGKALVTEPTAKLIGIMDIQRDGGGYKASDGFNLLASTDEWMSPIFADVGPDGAIWVIDFYSFIIQHNPTPSIQSAGIQATTGRGGAYKTENDLRDQTHGRIYRVVWKDGPKSSIKSLAKAKSPELVAALDSGNQFWSLTAQRLIVDNKMKDAAPALKKRVTSGTGGKGAIHALWSLEGIGALDKDTHQKALLDKDPALRRNAIRALPANEAGRQLFFSSAVIQDPDLLTRQVAFVKLAEFPTIPEIQTVVAQLPRVAANTNDAFLNDTLTLLGRIHKVSGVGENEVKVAAGDAKRGEDLFYNSPTAACASCHMVNGKGGDVGPILDGIAVRADKDYIVESLMDPNAKLAKGFESLTISPMPPARRAAEGTGTCGHSGVSPNADDAAERRRDGSSEKAQPTCRIDHAGERMRIRQIVGHHRTVCLVVLVMSNARAADALKPDSEGYIRHWVMLAPIALPEGETGAEADLQGTDQGRSRASTQGRRQGQNQREGIDLAEHHRLDQLLRLQRHSEDPQRPRGRLHGHLHRVRQGNARRDRWPSPAMTRDASTSMAWTFTRSANRARSNSMQTRGRFTLKKGVNVVVFKIINEQNNWQGAMRFLDKAGAPVKDLKIKLSP